MIKILLTQGQETIIDDSNRYLSAIKWYAVKSASGYYVSRKWYPDGKPRQQHLHHLVLGILRLPKKLGICVDHINGNTLDNRRSNLRIVTLRQNGQNRKEHRRGHLVGTTLNKTYKNPSKPWNAAIIINKKRKNLGYFKTQKEAHDVYMRACARLSE